MTRRTRFVSAATILLVGLIPAAATVAHADSNPASIQPPANPPAPSPTLAANLAAQRNAEKLLGQVAAGLLPGVGTVRIDDSGRLVVGTTGNLLPAVSAALAAVTAGTPFDVVPAKYSQADLDALTVKLNEAAAGLTAAGVNMTSWGPDLVRDTVTVHLAQYDAASAAKITSQFPGQPIFVDPVSQGAVASGRAADSAPWFGGDKIVGSLACSSSFGFHDNASHYYTVTAAHCGYNPGTVYYQNGAKFGTVTSYQWGGSNTDAALVQTNGSTSSYVWADPNQTSRAITSVAASDPVGGLICTDGAAALEVCSVRIDGTGQTVTYNNHTITGAVAAHSLQGLGAFAEGNSGGPVYTATGTTGEARGIVDAHYVNDTTGGWYTPIRFITAAFPISFN